MHEIKPLHDAALLATLHAASFPRPWGAEEFARLMAQPGVAALGSAEGFILFRVAADEAEILTLAVHPDARRQGLGRALLRAGTVLAGILGAEAMFLEVQEDNAAAIGLYRGAGFAEAARRKGYYQGKDALVMRHAIA